MLKYLCVSFAYLVPQTGTAPGVSMVLETGHRYSKRAFKYSNRAVRDSIYGSVTSYEVGYISTAISGAQPFFAIIIVLTFFWFSA